MVALPIPLILHCSLVLQQVYFVRYDFVDGLENPSSLRSNQPQFLVAPVQQQPDFELYPSNAYSPGGYTPAYTPAYTPDYTPDYCLSPSYPSPALTNNVSFSASPYQSFEGDFSMVAPAGLAVTGVPMASPISFASSPVPVTHALPSPSPLQPPRQMPPPAATSPTKRRGRSYICPQCNSSFTRPADVKRHKTSVHNPNHIDCPVPDCGRKGNSGFPRQDHLTEHLRSLHNWDIPKRAFTAGTKRVVKRRKCD
ncbi:uncharacterized protein TRUGW13939_01494 [Talaromyces rugulosus]|uniref:C2H2-type domain-containing protein n=1 Tax=Talaromyces rugulosus TaxID=121627 RepID=A0A7H8QKN1_TALRU|nr:uncharacterized protein TRUGW13939_01494 [Talaromyces rugulosus]QKX54408.1 hypothetical protein TRUGW13939_01494 [Talaromyces rugulosus]